MKIRNIEINSFVAFLIFLHTTNDLDFPKFLDSLGIEKAIEFFKVFGGRKIEVPSLETLDKCLKYFKGMEVLSNQSGKLTRSIMIKLLKKMNFSDEEVNEYFFYYYKFINNYPELYREYLRNEK